MSNERPVTEDDVSLMLANPFYCINIHPMLALEHQTMVSEEQWIAAALVQIKEDPQEFLKNLLRSLK